jgi:hypothetical protein
LPDDHAGWLCSRCKSAFGAISSPSKLRSIQILRSYLAPFPEGAALTEVFGWMCLVPLEALIRETTTLCREQRRELEPGLERAQWRETTRQPRTPFQSLKFGKRRSLPAVRQTPKPLVLAGGGSIAKVHTSCTCPRCHFPQSHDGHGMHGCVSCGWTLHKKRELSLQRKGREWERSL